jgi:N-glycosylase/DNA lyase
VQTFLYLKRDEIVERHLPSSDEEVIPGVVWGRVDELFTVAYWLGQYWLRENEYLAFRHRIGQTFQEEVVACMLGGHGIPAEVGLAAFERLRDIGLIAEPDVTPEAIADHLRRPLTIGTRQITYRFWSRKSTHIAATLRSLQEHPPSCVGRDLRDYLITLPGIGPKTASWIVRNWFGSDEVAILDVHVIRAGKLMGLYSEDDRVERTYHAMEARFLDLANHMTVSPANLDSLIWSNMRLSPRLVASLFDQPGKLRHQAAQC